jgi:hypothetical protein
MKKHFSSLQRYAMTKPFGNARFKQILIFLEQELLVQPAGNLSISGSQNREVSVNPS